MIRMVLYPRPMLHVYLLISAMYIDDNMGHLQNLTSFQGLISICMYKQGTLYYIIFAFVL